MPICSTTDLPRAYSSSLGSSSFDIGGALPSPIWAAEHQQPFCGVSLRNGIIPEQGGCPRKEAGVLCVCVREKERDEQNSQ